MTASRFRADAIALADRGDVEEALAYFRQSGEGTDLSVLLARERRYDEAIEAVGNWMAEQPDLPQLVRGYAQLAAIYYETGDIDSMERVVALGIKIDPTNPKLMAGKAAILLGHGNKSGWGCLRHLDWHKSLQSACPVPEWRGEDISGKSIVVIGVEGLGDQVMYSRFLNPLLERAGHVYVRPSDTLARLISHNFPKAEVLLSDLDLHGRKIDVWTCTGIIAENLPSPGLGPYLKERYKRPAIYSQGFHVGLCWRGGIRHPQDRNRSLGWKDVEPLLKVEGATFHSLQFDEREGHGGLNMEIKPYHDFLDTAGLVSQLNLVISVDTAVAHLSAAMGIPTWLLLKTPIDWRWGGGKMERNDWYGGVTQFRNSRIEDVVGKLRQVLDLIKD